ncbi:MAG: dihydroneopterin aldolase [Acidimicrobiales bacterium]
MRGRQALGICGVLTEEQARAQPLEVDLDVYLDLGAAGTGDDLAGTVDYGSLCAAVEQVITTERFQLLEGLAQRLHEVALAADERVDAVTVAVRKLRPPVPQLLRSSGVRVHRRRGGG